MFDLCPKLSGYTAVRGHKKIPRWYAFVCAFDLYRRNWKVFCGQPYVGLYVYCDLCRRA